MRRPALRAFFAFCVLHAGIVTATQQIASPNPGTGNATETPSQFYLRYRSAVQNANSLDEVTKFWQKSLAAEFNQAPPDQRVDLAAMKRMYAKHSDVTVVGVSIGAGGSTATMKLTGKTADGKTTSGAVSVVQENGSWKVAAPEEWQEPSSK
jgi:hypothetical protein